MFGRSAHGGTQTLGSAPSVTPHGGDGDEYRGAEPDDQDGDVVAGVVTRGEPADPVGAATDTDHPRESSRFHSANRYGGMLAVPETMAGVTNTARKPHRA